MSDKRVIKINPDVFKIPNATRKQRNSSQTKSDRKPLKVKSPQNERKDTVKRKMMNYLRKKQDDKLEAYMKPKLEAAANPVQDFKSDFQESMDYLNSVVEKNANVIPVSHNTTIKNYSLPTAMSSPSIYTSLPDSLHDVSESLRPPSSPYEPMQINMPKFGPPPPQPSYGCLKNGSLPTYRTWKNQTQKAHPPSIVTPSIVTPSIVTPSIVTPSIVNPMSIINTNSSNLVVGGSNEASEAVKLSKYKQMQQLVNQPTVYNKPKKKRKIVRRNYTIGRSRQYPKIGVLVSNKTIRKNITTKKTLLQQTSIHDIKKFLIKKGFIKVGSIAPNDVLRKMYETVNMMCGDVQNHNPDNLLYNYFNYNGGD